MTYENPWLYDNKEIDSDDIPPDAIAFVYLITNLKTSKKYIGKKTLYFYKKVKVKGKKKTVKAESDWKEYYGSNAKLRMEVEEFGACHFQRTVLYFCRNKGEANYLELREQIDRRALENDDYYNDYIFVRVNRNHIKNKSKNIITQPEV